MGSRLCYRYTYVDIPVRRSITSESPHAILIDMSFEPFLVVYLGTYVRTDGSANPWNK
jgi:hypothetical protein